MHNIIRNTVAILLLTTGIASAAAVVVPNFSFENPDLADAAFTSATVSNDTTAVPGWVTTINSGPGKIGVWNPQNPSFLGTTGPDPGGNVPGSAQGLQILYLAFNRGSGLESVTSGTIAAIEANTTYLLTAAVGSDLFFNPDIVSIALLVNGAVAASSSTTGASIPNGGFIDVFTSFTTLPAGDPRVGGNLAIKLTSSTTNSSDIVQVNFDNIRVDASVPEPSTGALLLGGTLAIAFRRRKIAAIY